MDRATWWEKEVEISLCVCGGGGGGGGGGVVCGRGGGVLGEGVGERDKRGKQGVCKSQRYFDLLNNHPTRSIYNKETKDFEVLHVELTITGMTARTVIPHVLYVLFLFNVLR